MAVRMFEMLRDDFDNTQENDNVEDYKEEEQEEQEEQLTQPKRFIPNLISNAYGNELLVYLQTFCLPFLIFYNCYSLHYQILRRLRNQKVYHECCLNLEFLFFNLE